MKHLQPKTLRAYLAILTARRFDQRELWKTLNRHGRISIGMVNAVVNDLVNKRFVERTGRNAAGAGKNFPGTSSGGYELSDPAGLLQYISMFRRMPELRLFSRRIRAGRAEVIRELAARKVVFCLGTAMEFYSDLLRPEEISFYGRETDALRAWLDTAPAGSTQVSCYRPDYVRSAAEVPDLFQDRLFSGRVGGKTATTTVQTAVDLFCDGKGAYAAPLLKELWGVVL